MPTIDLTDAELAAVVAAIRRAVEEDRFPRAPLITDSVLTPGVNGGDGSISITPLASTVPEPSTWAMTLTGFAGLGWLASRRRRNTSPA
jgi:hypothetical protein